MSSQNVPSVDEKKRLIFKTLNEVQQQAVAQTEGPVLIAAGAGSGKTRVLTHRIAHLVLLGVPPQNILAVTFTRKAAGEIKERVRALVDQYVPIGTFHSVCLGILKAESAQVGYGSRFSIYDDYDQLSLIKQCMEKCGLKETDVKPQALASRIDRLKCDMVYPEEFLQNGFSDESFFRVYQMYQEHLRRNQIMDYNDLICLCVRLFETNPAVLDRYRERFRYILVDEYQDTNHSQYLFIRALASQHRNVCVVGDSDQSIYGFRGANLQNFLQFEKDFPDAKIFKMEQNYRSTRTILNAANALMKGNQHRHSKQLWTERGQGEKLTLFRGDSERQEALFIIDTVRQLVSQGFKHRDIVIFYRVHALSRVIEEELVRSATPYMIVGGTGFYQRKEIKDLISILKVIVFPNDVSALKRVIQILGGGIGPKTIATVEQFAEEKALPFSQALASPDQIPGLRASAVKGLHALHEYLDRLAKGTQGAPSITHMVETVLEVSGILEEYRKEDTPESRARIENLKEFISVAREFDQRDTVHTLEEFLDQLLISSAIDQAEEAADSVTLMTLHSAKGLEFRAVIILGLEEGLLPHINAFESQKELEEERRLFYVGITRALDRLILCSVSDRLIYGYKSYRPPSTFLQEIPAPLIEKHENKFTVDQPDPKPAAAASAPKPAAAENVSYQVGALVLHPAFGPGKITAVSGERDKTRLDIFFTQKGTTVTILPKYAHLKVLK